MNFIYSGPNTPSCRLQLNLDDREPLHWSEMPITFDWRDHWVHLPKPGSYPLVVNPLVSQVHLAKVLVDGGSGLNIIFSNTLENMGYDMTTLVPSD